MKQWNGKPALDVVFHSSSATLCKAWLGHRVGVTCPTCGLTPRGKPKNKIEKF